MNVRKLRSLMGVMVILLAALVAGCSQKVAESGGSSIAGTALSTDYDGALDVMSQLALGLLKLEATSNAITEAQAAALLPLWQTLQGGALQGADETAAVQRQIEKALTDGQLAAIGAMQLTEEDVQTWLAEEDAGLIAPGGFTGGAPAGGFSGGPPANMTAEDRAALRESRQAGGAGGGRPAAGPGAPEAGGGSSMFLTVAVVRLLAERSGQEVEMAPPPGGPPGDLPGGVDMPDEPEGEGRALEPAPEVTATPEAEAEIVEEETSVSDAEAAEETVTEAPTPEVVSTIETSTEPAAAEEAPTTDAAEAAAEVATVDAVSVASGETGVTAAMDPGDSSADVIVVADTVSVTPALIQVPDTNPGPPFSVAISLNRAEPSPLLDGLTVYKVSGILTNEGSDVWAVNTVNFTFYDADGFRGSFYQFPRRRYGEWIEHGAMKADFDCLLLSPGESCPFTAEIAAYNMGSFYVHADAVVAQWREPAPVAVTGSQLLDQGSNIRITTTVANDNTYAIKNVVVCGALVDGNGQITGIGSGYYVQSIAPGASVTVNVLIPADDYVTYQLFAQAEGDFK